MQSIGNHSYLARALRFKLRAARRMADLMRVLVVEDNSALATIIGIALEETGYEIRTARNGDEGYSAYLVFKPDVIVTDICMPGKDGLEMMKQIRVHHPCMRTIYITAQVDRFRLRLEQEKKDYPVTVLEKPFSRTDLANLISAKIGTNLKPPTAKERPTRSSNRS